MKRAILIAALLLAGCATVREEISTPEGYAKCAAADLASTALFLSTTAQQEANPIVKALTVKALGHVAGTLIPGIGLSIAVYYGLKWLNQPAVTTAATVLTCASAVRNVYLVGVQP